MPTRRAFAEPAVLLAVLAGARYDRFRRWPAKFRAKAPGVRLVE